MKSEPTTSSFVQSKKNPISPARRTAFTILQRVAAERACAAAVIDAETTLSREDHGLAQELVLGVLRQQRALDYLIEKYTKRKIEKLDLAVLLALRLGLYQLRYLTRIPQ